ncbi:MULTISPECIES: hypothetical protein [unclassified Roseovarius]|uniref:hypothetical protein n=1 Tax=unclassified Roseovarius TaxID=2614913 RepID=UPI0000685B13|nr:MULTISPECIES: hypothetical protein [unclassified Roseovarius]EAQ27063.1 hypothetical protein ROS217_21092 [Roseovarius sp. 217]KJS44980.1 MAG: acyltransferase [Roseovarius sp. BRH_c41]
MIVIIGAILGALTGALMAWRRKGKLADILQYAFVLALIFALLGLFLTLIIHRSAL